MARKVLNRKELREESDAAERRARAHAAANGIGDWFRDPSRSGKLGRPDVVVITDETGTVVARDADPNRMHGQKLSKALPKLREVLSEGRVETDVWADEAQAMTTQQLAMAPIRDERGKILGALVVGYGITDGVHLSIVKSVPARKADKLDLNRRAVSLGME